MDVMAEELVTTDIAAAELGVSRWAVLKAIHQGRLHGEKLGRDYVIERPELERYKRERRGRGRPPKAVSLEYPNSAHVVTGRLVAERTADSSV